MDPLLQWGQNRGNILICNIFVTWVADFRVFGQVEKAHGF
jgi:hypothetical protein